MSAAALVLLGIVTMCSLPKPTPGFLLAPSPLNSAPATPSVNVFHPTGRHHLSARRHHHHHDRARRRPQEQESRVWCMAAGEAEGGGATGASVFAEELGVLDKEQARMMAEECILVDRNDVPTGSASKVETHLCSKGLLLHRAFSVFLFDREGRLLMQRRADSKHTFPGFWTNSCCSHPLSNERELGTDTGESGVAVASEGQAAVLGATRAAVRKLGQELGIPAAQISLDDFSFLTKVHYIASSGSTWGEHEIDYVFVLQVDVDLDPNPNEVSEAEFLDREGLRALLAAAERGEVEFTPWSRYIIDRFVFEWWDHVGDKDRLKSFRDDVIHRVGTCAEK